MKILEMFEIQTKYFLLFEVDSFELLQFAVRMGNSQASVIEAFRYKSENT